MFGLRTRERTAPAAARPSRFAHPAWAVAAGSFIGLLVIAGVVVVLHGPGEASSPAVASPAPSIPAPRTAEATPSPTGPVACPRLPVAVQAAPATGPAAQWIPVGRVQAPSSPEFGPVLTDGGLPRCYPNTPTGALFAAANFMAAVTDAARLQRAVAELTAEGPGRNVLIDRAATNPVTLTGGGVGFDTVAFAFLSITDRAVSVAIVVRAANGGMAAVPVTLTWDGDDVGDWKVQVPDSGSMTGGASPLTDLTGYVPWSAP